MDNRPVAAIESPANPLIREIARSSRRENAPPARRRESRSSTPSPRESALDHVLHDASVRPGRLAALTAARPRLVSRAVLERLADSRTPQHLLAVAPAAGHPRRGNPRPARDRRLRLRHPGSRATSGRSSASSRRPGRSGVLAGPGSADFFHPRAVRGSAGSVLRVPVSGRVSFEPFAGRRPGGRPRLCGAVSEGGEDPFTSPLPAASVLVIGAEGAGLPAGAYRYLDRRLTIPMRPPVDSLNAAVAAALLLYSARLAPAAHPSADASPVD